MDDYRHAIARIRYLIGEGPYQATPATITGDSTEIRSYDLVIVDRWDGVGWYVHTENLGQPVNDGKRSPTTDRHINAALAVFTDPH